ncbi:DNA repair protein RecN [Eisenibacter elegans]|jgi:DNA repair protein RecN (Recombination protein N)|uniref:DNA repair protein RecN n=1 Tax=Eisenibacter elegans TaxID=997 RepID=UPI000408BDA7|nr:DNA repair protein RecN [Eisenibacter elegans]
MLSKLLIKNYALITHLEIAPHQAFNIITGETGAGKSIMLGAIGLLLGNRADMKALFNTEEKCIVEAWFDVRAYANNLRPIFEAQELDFSEETNIRREISPSGKSRAFVNDTPVTLEVLREIGTQLIDVHSQHDNLMLGDNRFQLRVVDACAGTQAEAFAYQHLYKKYRLAENRYLERQREYQEAQKELDYHKFLLDELEQANLQADEQTQLEAEASLLDNTEEIKAKLHWALGLLGDNEEAALLNGLASAAQALAQIAHIGSPYNELYERLESCRIELADLHGELGRAEEQVEFDPLRLQTVQERLSLLFQLQKKHGVSTVEELLQIQDTLAQKVNQVLNFDDEIQTLAKERDALYQQVVNAATQLSDKRQAVIPQIETELKAFFADLGMPNAVLRVVRQETEPLPDGIDLINFLFSANKGVAPQEIGRVASGGEFSRLMLAIKYILAGHTALPTIIFDEIDTGISGEIALKMGKMMKEMSAKHQVIAISHLHQIAAKGNHHYFVYKDDSAERTISRMKQLSEEERVYEIAQMISGATPSESAILSAKELLAQ